MPKADFRVVTFFAGTTDITRTNHWGTPTEEQKHCFTRVLQGHIALASAVFPEGTPGAPPPRPRAPGCASPAGVGRSPIPTHIPVNSAFHFDRRNIQIGLTLVHHMFERVGVWRETLVVGAGLMLDTLARGPLWRDGLTYGHGTGHGMGAYLNVHEGPRRIDCRSICLHRIGNPTIDAKLAVSFSIGRMSHCSITVGFTNGRGVNQQNVADRGDQPCQGSHDLKSWSQGTRLVCIIGSRTDFVIQGKSSAGGGTHTALTPLRVAGP